MILNITYQKLAPHQVELFKQLNLVFEEAFEMKDFLMPSDDYLQSLLEQEFYILFVAQHQQQVVGGLRAHILSSTYGDCFDIYVYDLAVKTNYQRKGIGSSLMKGIKDYGRYHGAKEIFVQADFNDSVALNFYRKINGREENVRHFSFPTREQ